MLKLNQMNGWHLYFPDLSSGEGVAPYRTVADYDNGLARVEGFIAWLDRTVERLREGQRNGIVLPRVVTERVIAQLDQFAAQGGRRLSLLRPSPQAAPRDAGRGSATPDPGLRCSGGRSAAPCVSPCTRFRGRRIPAIGSGIGWLVGTAWWAGVLRVPHPFEHDDDPERGPGASPRHGRGGPHHRRHRGGMETLYLHEATPGHHMQMALAAEDLGLQNFCASMGTRLTRRDGLSTRRA